MKVLSFIFLFGFSVSVFAKTESCELALAPTPLMGVETFSNFVALPSGTEMYVRMQKPRFREPKGWYFLIHGLMDSHRAYDSVAKNLIHEGFAVVRMDLKGFARTLHRDVEKAVAKGKTYEAPLFIDFKDQVRDLKDLLIYLRNSHGVQDPHIVGHSMGGGLAMALLADTDIQPLVGRRATLIAPYVYRLEFYLMEKFLFGALPVAHSIPDLQFFVPPMFKFGSEFLTDTFIANAAMSEAFGALFDQLAEARLAKIDPKDWEVVRKRHIDAAIAAVKGLRELNSMDLVRQIPPDMQVDLIYGNQDKVVDETLARRLGRRLTARGGLEFALDTGHMTLNENPKQVARILVNRRLEP